VHQPKKRLTAHTGKPLDLPQGLFCLLRLCGKIRLSSNSELKAYMNPLDFNFTAEQQVTVTNPTGEPHRWTVYGKAYEVAPGKTAKMPGYIAWVYVYEMAANAAQADGQFNSWNDEGFKQKYYDRFIIGADELVREVVEEQPDVTTFDEEDPTPGQGGNYTPKVNQRGRSTKV
jgi:hypothetical protein